MQTTADTTRKRSVFYTAITEQMYDELITLQKNTHFQTLNKLCGHILAGKKLVVQYIDGPPDTLLPGITTSCRELQQKCSAINQLTGKIFGETDPEVLMTDARAARRLFQEINDLMDPLQTKITEISKRWLPCEEPG